MSEIEIEELKKGDIVAFAKPESRAEPAVGYIQKVNRQTYQICLLKPWKQQRRTYPVNGQFRVSKNMVWRYMGIELEDLE